MERNIAFESKIAHESRDIEKKIAFKKNENIFAKKNNSLREIY